MALFRDDLSRGSTQRENGGSCNSLTLRRDDRHITNHKYHKMAYLNRILLCETPVSNSRSGIIVWDDVRCVDIIANEPVSCPICLSDACVPYMLECGHVFCLICVLLHFTTACSCCVCNQYAVSKELRSVRIQYASSINSGTVRSFQLVKTNHGITLPQDFSDIPSESVVGWWFSPLVLISDLAVSRHHLSELNIIRQNTDQSLEGIHSFGSILAEEFLQVRIDSLPPCSGPHSFGSTVQLDTDSLYSCLPFTMQANDSFAYQSVDGQHVYLEPVWMRALLLHFCQDPDGWDKMNLLPGSLAFPILFTTTTVVDKQTRLRYRQIHHLPLGTSVMLVDVDIRGIVSPSVLETLSESITRRVQLIKRVKDQRRTDKRDIKRENAIPLSRDWKKNFNVYTTQKIPTDSDFSHSLSSNAVDSAAAASAQYNTSYAAALGSAPGFADSQISLAEAALTRRKGRKFK